jgi:hypothetical protein
VLYDYALWAAFCDIRLTHDTVSRATPSRALFCDVDLSNSTEILLCAQGPVTPEMALVKVRECAEVFKSRSQCLCFAFLSWVSSRLFQFNPCCSLVRDVLHHADSFRCHDSLLPSSATPLPQYIVQQSAVLFGVFIHKLAALGRLI